MVFLSAKPRLRAARARAEEEARVVLDVTSSAEHDGDPLDTQVRAGFGFISRCTGGTPRGTAGLREGLS